jgi:multiple antibiotic resistance protein
MVDNMLEMLTLFLQAFVPLFVAIDAPGVLPLYMALTDGLTSDQRRRVLAQSILTGAAVSLGFLFLGQAVFRLMGITISDFAIAGGVLVFIIATSEVVTGRKQTRELMPHGAVPLGTPLIVGPATLTTTLLLAPRLGIWLTLASLMVNLAIVWVILRGAEVLERVLGKAGSKALSKVAALILAAYAVMMIRTGVLETASQVAAQH